MGMRRRLLGVFELSSWQPAGLLLQPACVLSKARPVHVCTHLELLADAARPVVQVCGSNERQQQLHALAPHTRLPGAPAGRRCLLHSLLRAAGDDQGGRVCRRRGGCHCQAGGTAARRAPRSRPSCRRSCRCRHWRRGRPPAGGSAGLLHGRRPGHRCGRNHGCLVCGVEGQGLAGQRGVVGVCFNCRER